MKPETHPFNIHTTITTSIKWCIYKVVFGYDSTWRSQSERNPSFSYMALPSGRYTFEIRSNMLGILSPIYNLTFFIPQPFYTTWIFIVGMAIVFIILLSIGFQLLLRRQHKKQAIKEQLLLSQVTALRTQMNPHFIFNVLNAVQGLIYTNKKNEASQYLGSFSNLMRRTLESSDKLEIPLSKELEMLKLYVEIEAARFEDNDFSYIIDSQLNEEELCFPVPSLVIQPFVKMSLNMGCFIKMALSS